jgi:K319L-like, PKD domain
MRTKLTSTCLAPGLGVVLAVALGLVGCTRPLGAWFPGDNNNHNSNFNFNGNHNFNGNLNNNAVNYPPLAMCPEDVTTGPGWPVVLVGNGDDDHGIVGWTWQVVSAPPGGVATPSPANAKDTTFAPDLVGDYSLRLTVVDGGGLTSSCEMMVSSRIGPPTAICPDDMTAPTRTPVTLVGDGIDDGTIVAWSWEVMSHNTDTDPSLSTPNAQSTSFEALRVGVYVMRFTVEDNHGLTNWCEFTITTTPTGPTAICPQDIDAIPLVQISFSGDAEDDGNIVSWRWQMVGQPTGSSASPPSPATSPAVTFMPDIVGEFQMRLTVVDDDGMEDTCDFSVFALGEGLRVEIFWNPPEDPNDSSDVDLHLLHPSAPGWFDGQFDCYYSNCNVSSGPPLPWDVANDSDDDPRLDLDDTQGYGPENINIDAPVVGHEYKVGVHYFSANGQGPAAVYVKIYCGTVSINPVYETGPMQLYGSSGGSWDNDFWKVASVMWNGWNCSVTPINQVIPASQAETNP